MKNKRLCVDIDNCVAATDVVMRRIIHSVTGGLVNLQYEDIREFDYHGSLCRDANGNGIDERTWKEVHDRFSEPEIVLDIGHIPGSVEALRAIQSNFEIHFVTTRRPKARAATLNWLDHLGLDSTRSYSVHFVAHREKHEVIAGIAAAIDDDAVQAALFKERGVRSIVLAHPWNNSVAAGVERVQDWNAIRKALSNV